MTLPQALHDLGVVEDGSVTMQSKKIPTFTVPNHDDRFVMIPLGRGHQLFPLGPQKVLRTGPLPLPPDMECRVVEGIGTTPMLMESHDAQLAIGGRAVRAMLDRLITTRVMPCALSVN